MYTKKWRQLIPAIIAIAIFSVYAPSLQNDFIDLDDRPLIINNSSIQGLTSENIKHAFTSYDPELYVPLTKLSYQLEYSMFGLSSTVIHTTNLLLHIGSALLVYLILLHLFKSVWLACALALIFGLHPLQVEAVAWASARKDVLSAFFFFASLLSYLYFDTSKKMKWYALSLGAFLLGLLSKVHIVTLPILLLIYHALLTKKTWNVQRATLIPYFLLSLTFGIVGLFGKTTNIEALTLIDQLLLYCKQSAFLLLKIFAPTNLALLYQQSDPITLLDSSFAISIIAILVLIGIAIWQWKKRPLISFGILFFLVALTPGFAGFTKKGFVFFASDRFAYIPLLGILIFIGFLLKELSSIRIREYPNSKSIINRIFGYSSMRLVIFYAITTFVIISLSIVTYFRTQSWKDAPTLHAADLRSRPNSHLHLLNMAAIHLDEKQPDKAIPLLEKAIELEPEHPLAYANMGAAYGMLEEYELGVQYYLKALELDPKANIPKNMQGIIQ